MRGVGEDDVCMCPLERKKGGGGEDERRQAGSTGVGGRVYREPLFGAISSEEVMLGLRRGGSFTLLPPVSGLYIFAIMVFF